MPHPSRDQYLETKIDSASQPQLHRMLLEGAIRYGRQAQAIWVAGVEYADVDILLAQMSDIVDELTHGAMAGTEEVSKQFEEQYAFIYSELTASRFNEDPERLGSCVTLLAYVRETWILASEKLDSEKATSVATAGLPHIRLTTELPTEGISLEA